MRKVHEEIALEPCPFCGADAEMLENGAGDDFVRCTDPQCAARTRLHHENHVGAAMAWNRRVPPPGIRRDPIQEGDRMPGGSGADHDGMGVLR